MSLKRQNFTSDELWQLYDAGEDDSLAVPNQSRCIRLLDALAEAGDPADLAYEVPRQNSGEYHLEVDHDHEIKFVWADGRANEIELVEK